MMPTKLREYGISFIGTHLDRKVQEEDEMYHEGSRFEFVVAQTGLMGISIQISTRQCEFQSLVSAPHPTLWTPFRRDLCLAYIEKINVWLRVFPTHVLLQELLYCQVYCMWFNQWVSSIQHVLQCASILPIMLLSLKFLSWVFASARMPLPFVGQGHLA